MIDFAVIPAASGGTVADGDKKVWALPASGPNRAQQVSVKATSVGTHAALIFTIEGFERGSWINLARSHMNPNLGLTANELGIALTAAQATAGVMINFDAQFSQYRFGIAGDGAGGAAFVAPRQTR